ncbi:ATP-binding cassette domain-containing protein [Shimazuella kribbensis]|uniref:ATP-binding cassette domain-containing protein n=1 Tax=Shimazuella kribbensis TaxID=139808 RepID=UPI000426F7B2|nr:ATP-binding cassette domain-containing protein [Shimazuella kribbensis]
MKTEWKFVYNNISLQTKKEYVIQQWNMELFPMEQFAFLGGEIKQQIPFYFLLGGYINPSKGDVFLLENSQKHPIKPSDVGMGPIPNFTPFFTELRVRESLIQHSSLFGVRNANKRTDQLIEQWGLQSVQKERLRDLNEDYMRCSEIAMALVHYPKLLLLDHPERHLTKGKWQAIWDHLLDIQKQEGFAISITTHDQYTASRCSKTMLLEENKR